MSKDAYSEQYSRASEKASQVARQVAFAGIGVVWIFSGGPENPSHPNISGALLWGGLALVVALGFDLLHATYLSLLFGITRASRKRRRLQTETLDNPSWVNYPTLFFFYGKLLLVVVAYVFLGFHVADLLADPPAV